MKNILYTLFFILIASACNSLHPLHSLEKSFAEASYQKFAMGAPGAGRGITFRVKFYNLTEPLKSDTLWVNNLALQTELTKVGDTTYVNAFYASNVEYQPPLILDTDYAGVLNIYVAGKAQKMEIKSFTRIPEAFYP